MDFFLQAVQQMEGLDFVSDSCSTEIIGLMIVERIWSKVRAYLDERHDKIDKKQEDTRMDKIAEDLAEIKGKQKGFEAMLKAK